MWGEMRKNESHWSPFSLDLRECGHPCPRHCNDNLLEFIFLLSLGNVTYTKYLLRVPNGKEAAVCETMLWQGFWFLAECRAYSVS